MKKLMIAAVLACATVAVAEAKKETVKISLPVYQFTATLKTTQGKQGKASYSDYYLLGRKSNAAVGKQMWYNAVDSEALADLEKAGSIVYERGKSYPTLLLERDGTIYRTNDIAKAEAELIAVSKAGYNEKSEGVVCAKFRVYIPAECFRVVGSAKINDAVAGRPCCYEPWVDGGFTNATTGAYINTNFGETKGSQFFHWFGAQSDSKCNKVEMVAQVEFPSANNFKGAIAGQGACNKGGYMTTLSGNIVGYMNAPVCKDCCTELDQLPDAIAFDCIGTRRQNMGKKDDTPLWKYDERDSLSKTAAFGSFRMKLLGMTEIEVEDK